MFLMIENKGECPIEGFTILGVSSSRAKEENIGQFGSGSKHGVNTLLRHNISPTIYSGKTKITFFTKPKRMKETNYGLVCANINGKIQELGFCLEFGELDWTEEWHGVREFISNALDEVDNPKDVKIEVVDEEKSKVGYTRVFLPLTAAIQKCYNEIYDRFLHFDDRINHRILNKTKLTPVKIYRQGVFVKEQTDISLFDYNFSQEFKIDESRNLDSTNCKSECSKLLSSHKQHLVEVFKSFILENAPWEHTFGYWDLTSESWKTSQKSLWQEAWKETNGEAIITNNKLGEMMQILGSRGIEKTIITVPQNWYDALEKHGIPTIMGELHEVEQKGYEIVEATSIAKKELDICWDIFESIKLTIDKDKPQIKSFHNVASNDEHIYGFYKNNIVYINIDAEYLRHTVLEELSHHISGAQDNTRDFTEFTLQALTRLSQKLGFE